MKVRIIPESLNTKIDDELYHFVDRDDFQIGQSYEQETAKTLVCNCGNDKFIVGQGSHFTCIKCSNCNYQIPIHQG